MGFLKNMINSITGNWADISLETGQGVRGTEIPVKVRIQVKENAIEMINVYVKIRAVEEVHGHGSGNCSRCSQSVSVNYNNTYTVYENKAILSGPGTLQPNQYLELEGKLQIPAELFSTYNGQNVHLRYEILAGIDMKGNDPDSGWAELWVS